MKKEKTKKAEKEDEHNCCKHEEHQGDDCGCDCSEEESCQCQEGCGCGEAKNSQVVYDELYQKYLMTLADIKNNKILWDKEKEMMRKYYFQTTLEKILPVLDAFEMAFKISPPNKETENYLKGFEFIYQLLKDALLAESVMVINPKIGDKFDSNIHFASETAIVDKIEDADKVVEVYLKGYQINNRVIRNANVKVSIMKNMSETKEVPSKGEN